VRHAPFKLPELPELPEDKELDKNYAKPAWNVSANQGQYLEPL
jgi:hypothetical protein